MRWLNTKYDQMDEIDFEIMSLLYILEEQPFTEIQKALKKSPTVIDGRLKKLLRRGLISRIEVGSTNIGRPKTIYSLNDDGITQLFFVAREIISNPMYVDVDVFSNDYSQFLYHVGGMYFWRVSELRTKFIDIRQIMLSLYWSYFLFVVSLSKGHFKFEKKEGKVSITEKGIEEYLNQLINESTTIHDRVASVSYFLNLIGFTEPAEELKKTSEKLEVVIKEVEKVHGLFYLTLKKRELEELERRLREG